MEVFSGRPAPAKHGWLLLAERMEEGVEFEMRRRGSREEANCRATKRYAAPWAERAKD